MYLLSLMLENKHYYFTSVLLIIFVRKNQLSLSTKLEDMVMSLMTAGLDHIVEVTILGLHVRIY